MANWGSSVRLPVKIALRKAVQNEEEKVCAVAPVRSWTALVLFSTAVALSSRLVTRSLKDCCCVGVQPGHDGVEGRSGRHRRQVVHEVAAGEVGELLRLLRRVSEQGSKLPEQAAALGRQVSSLSTQGAQLLRQRVNAGCVSDRLEEIPARR
jgi:hypothetical protein